MICGPFRPWIWSSWVVPVTTVGLLASATGPATTAPRTAMPRTVLAMVVAFMSPLPPVVPMGDEYAVPGGCAPRDSGAGLRARRQPSPADVEILQKLMSVGSQERLEFLG